MFVPGLAFNEKGYRIGYGKGYYDRWLKRFQAAKRIGLAYNFQVLKKLPKTKKDIKVGIIVTEKRIIAS